MLESPSQFRPGKPTSLTSREYATDFEQVKKVGRFDGTARTDKQTIEALFWTDHDLRQWNEGLLRLAAHRELDLVQTARMLAMTHVSGSDAMIACFDAKYHYMFWRPAIAIPRADTDVNRATEPDRTWRPLRAAPNFPEYPSAHACHSSGRIARWSPGSAVSQRTFGPGEHVDRLPSFSFLCHVKHQFCLEFGFLASSSASECS